MNQGRKSTGVQKQLTLLLIVLILISGFEAILFWQSLNQLFESYRAVSKTQTIVGSAGEIGRNFLEESKLRDSTSGSPERHALNDLKRKIRQNLKDMRGLVVEKESAKLIKLIQTEWQKSRGESGTSQLMLYVRALVTTQQKALVPLEAKALSDTETTKNFVIIYMAMFITAIIILGQYSRRRIFVPLGRLSEKIKNFEAGNYELPPQEERTDEIGSLETRFYNMANRVGETVTQFKELDKVKTDFISIASHELRTPMTSVKGSLSLILSGNLSEISPEVKEILTIAEKETDRLIRLINDILDLTKMEAKKLSLDSRLSSMNEVVESATQGLAGLYEVSKVSIKVTPPKQPMKAMMDKDRIQQVITNLLSNAVKFSPAGSTVVLKYEPHHGGVVVSITDQGPGIAQEFQSHMFEKFTSFDSGKSKIIKGTGLGLPICKAIIEQHGGQIGLKSELGMGSTFFFFLPEATLVNKNNQITEAA